MIERNYDDRLKVLKDMDYKEEWRDIQIEVTRVKIEKEMERLGKTREKNKQKQKERKGEIRRERKEDKGDGWCF